MAALTTQVINRAGLGPTYAAASAGGDTMPCDDGEFLHAKNASGSPITVTLAVPAGVSGFANIAYGNLAVSVPAGGERMIGPIHPQIFSDPTDGLAHITYSGVTSLTVAAIQLAQP